MENANTRQTIKLGIFVTGGLVLFLAVLFYMGSEGNLFNKTFTVYSIFKNVEGLKEGDNVWLSGVKIGTVKNVVIVDEGKVIVSLSLKDRQNQFIKKNATAFVGSDGLVGNKIVVIRPGTGRVIQDNDTVNALSPTDTQELFNLAKEVGVSTRGITDDLRLISQRLNKGEGLFGELLQDGPMSRDLRFTIESLKAASVNANHLTEEAKKLVADINHGDGIVSRLITDTTYARSFEKTLENAKSVGENSKRISEELQTAIAKMNTSDNTIGILLSDTLFAQKLRGTLINAQSASVKLNENMEALQHSFLLKGYFRKQKKAKDGGKPLVSP